MKQKNRLLSLLSIMMVAAIGVVLCSCGDDDPDEVTVYPPTVTFSAQGGQQSVSIKSNTNWLVSGMIAGVTVAPTSGSGDATITFVANENTDKNVRSGFYTITAGKASTVITFTQSGSVVDNQLEGSYVGTLKPMGYTDSPAPCYVTITKLAATTYRLSSLICEQFDINLNSGYNLVATTKSDGRIYLNSETSYSIEGSYYQGNLTISFSIGVDTFFFTGVKN